MIPAHVEIGSTWQVLPPGIHDATMGEIATRFAVTAHRIALFEGFRRGVENLVAAGCRNVYLDGSFVTNKGHPGDFDACFNLVGVDAQLIDPVMLDFRNGRLAQKCKYFGEFFPSSTLADGSNSYLNFFQRDKDTNKKKGIIRVVLGQP